jgi:hypothetical protein
LFTQRLLRQKRNKCNEECGEEILNTDTDACYEAISENDNESNEECSVLSVSRANNTVAQSLLDTTTIPRKENHSIKPVPIFRSATEKNHTLSLTILAMLVHIKDKSLLCQPNANYHSLRITDLHQTTFIKAMTKAGEDIMEEMYVFLYELTSDKGDDTVPIFTTNNTSFMALQELFKREALLFTFIKDVL